MPAELIFLLPLSLLIGGTTWVYYRQKQKLHRN